MIGKYFRYLCQPFGRLCIRSPFAMILLNLCGLGLFIFLCDWWVSRAGGFPLFDSVEQIPANEIALVLGTAPVLASGATPKIVAKPAEAAKTPAEANAMQVPAQ